MKIAIITANVGDIDNVLDIPKQNTSHEISFFSYTEKNLPFPLPNLDNRLKSKYLKIQTHKFLEGFDYFIWLDGRIEVISKDFVDKMLDFVGDKDVALPLHGVRSNVFEEMEYVLQHIEEENKYVFLRYGNQQMDKELDFYKQHKELKNIPLYHCACFIRKVNSGVNQFFDFWWEKCIQFSNFDQAMFAFTSFKNPQIKISAIETINLFDKVIANNKHQRNMIEMSTEDVYFKIKTNLIKRIPLAITRYGDGEAMVLDKEPEGEEYREYVFKRQLGDKLNEVHKAHIVSHLRIAYQKSDIIGIPTSRHKRKGDYWAKAQDILERHVYFNKNFCSIDIHQELLSLGYLDKLLKNRKKVYYISAYNLDEQLKRKYNIQDIQSFQIAPERKFNPNYDDEDHFPDQFKAIDEWIKTLDCAEALCLVGAGVVGKIYNIWFKEQGGISIDIGSVFDAWAGKNTRGVGRGPEAEDLEYKL